MGTTKKVMKTGITIPKEILEQAEREFKEHRKKPKPNDYPKLTPAELDEFQPVGMTWEERGKIMEERRANRKRETVSLRLPPDCLEWFKTMGKGYTGIMADVLTYAAKNPDIVKQAVL
ncbi:MAG TPA: hypothetical protein DEQ14_01015 [Treponema sp.]|nr:hypothetical protein [Treponema sp.]